MLNIKYFVRTTGERALDESFSQIDYELLIDSEHKPVKGFIHCLEVMNDYDAFLLEDDVILCKDFKARIEEVINQYPNMIINFFNAPTLYRPILIDSNFSFMQCRFYPKGSCEQFIEGLKSCINMNKVCPCLNRLFSNSDIRLVQYRPCLVQHLDNDSLVGNGCGHRRTPYFIDYLDELGITYEQAELNRDKLVLLMNSKFNRYE